MNDEQITSRNRTV